MTNTFVFIAGCFLMYTVTWIYLLYTKHQDMSQEIHEFLDCWIRDSYTVEARTEWSKPEIYLRVNFVFGQTSRYVDINQMGQLITGIYRSSNERANAPIPWYLRRQFGPIAEQIATMARLEGKFDD